MPAGVRDWVVSRATTCGYDWKHTPGFPPLADYNGYLRLNVEGRERLGCLSDDGPVLHSYRQFMADCFLELKPLDRKQSLVNKVMPVQHAFSGKHSRLLPDYAVTWQPAAPVDRIVSLRLGTFSAKLETGRSLRLVCDVRPGHHGLGIGRWLMLYIGTKTTLKPVE